MDLLNDRPRRAVVRALLGAHEATDRREATHVRACLELLDGPGDPFSRRSFIPGHLTASAFVLAPDGAALLLIRHPSLGRWLQPGGHVEPGDATLAEAARREVLEESGIALLDPAAGASAPFDVDVHPIPARGDEPGHRHHDVRFALRARSHRLPGGDVGAAAWVPLGRVADSCDEPAMRRVVGKLLRLADVAP